VIHHTGLTGNSSQVIDKADCAWFSIFYNRTLGTTHLYNLVWYLY